MSIHRVSLCVAALLLISATSVLVMGMSGAPWAGGQGAVSSKRPVTLDQLTVPKDRLPDGCSLKANPPHGIFIFLSMSDTLTTNPWMGTDHRILALLRRGIDAGGQSYVGSYVGRPLPDAVLTPREESLALLKFAEGVEEGYAAVYSQAGSPESSFSGAKELTVRAVRFAGRSEMRGDTETRLGIEIGLIRAVLSGGGGVCATAIENHLKSLAQ
jgi:hypothetical protein